MVTWALYMVKKTSLFLLSPQSDGYLSFSSGVGGGNSVRIFYLSQTSLSFPPSAPFLASVSEDCSLAVLDSGLDEV